MIIDVGDGKNTRFWFDEWIGKEHLIVITWAVDATYHGVCRYSKVSEVVNQDG